MADERDNRYNAFWEPAGSLEPKAPVEEENTFAESYRPAEAAAPVSEEPADLTETAENALNAESAETAEPAETAETVSPAEEPAFREEPQYTPMFDDDDPLLDAAAGHAAEAEVREPEESAPAAAEPAQEKNAAATGNGSYRYSSGHEYYDRYSGGEEGRSHEYAGGGSGSLRYTDDSRTKEKRRGSKSKAVFAVLLAVIFGLCTGAGAWGAGTLMKSSASVQQAEKDSGSDAEEKKDRTPETAGDEQQAEDSSASEQAQAVDPQFVTGSGENPSTDISEVAASVMPSIVSVYNSYIAESYYFGQAYRQEATSTGSGIIIASTDKELLIATNNHVVENAESLSVRFINDTEIEANVKGTDATHDLAVIAVNLADIDDETTQEIAIATLGSSETLKVGQAAVAIGNALGYGQSVTSGIVSAVNRQITSEDGITGTFIQTDAAINPGNSGGALVNMNGEVIGINSSKIGGSTVEGMGFAIPISDAQPIIEELMKQETRRKVADGQQGTLGISGATVSTEAQQFYSMPAGVYVAEVLDGGAASGSELQKGDIITEINGTAVTSMESLKKQLTYYEAGSSVQLTVARQGQDGSYEQTTMEVTLGTQDILTTQEQDTQGSAQQEQQDPQGGQRPDFGSDWQQGGNGLFGWPFESGEDEEGGR